MENEYAVSIIINFYVGSLFLLLGHQIRHGEKDSGMAGPAGSGIMFTAGLALSATAWGFLHPNNFCWVYVVLAALFVGVVIIAVIYLIKLGEEAAQAHSSDTRGRPLASEVSVGAASTPPDDKRELVHHGVCAFVWHILAFGFFTGLPLGIIYDSPALGTGGGLAAGSALMFITMGAALAFGDLPPSLSIRGKIDLLLIGLAENFGRGLERCLACAEFGLESCSCRKDRTAPQSRPSSNTSQKIRSAPESDVSFDRQFDERGLTRLERVFDDEVNSRERRRGPTRC